MHEHGGTVVAKPINSHMSEVRGRNFLEAEGQDEKNFVNPYGKLARERKGRSEEGSARMRKGIRKKMGIHLFYQRGTCAYERGGGGKKGAAPSMAGVGVSQKDVGRGGIRGIHER